MEEETHPASDDAVFDPVIVPDETRPPTSVVDSATEHARLGVIREGKTRWRRGTYIERTRVGFNGIREVTTHSLIG